jgi:hypothetical protein
MSYPAAKLSAFSDQHVNNGDGRLSMQLRRNIPE